MSLINFLHPKFKTKIETNCIPEDDYKASNLVSENIWEQDRGFMCYNLTKPPVDLVFNLEQSIEVHRIKIWPAVGQLRSNGFTVQVFNDIHFLVVCKYQGNESNTIEFYQQNTRYGHPETSDDAQSIQFFSSHDIRRSLNKTKSIKVTITSTQRCPPVLKRIEIWGRPNKQLDQESRQKCDDLWLEISRPICINSTNSVALVAPVLPDSSHYEDKAPDEFFDAITYELMIFPMRLPCGKAVDQSTIDKHTRIEEKWGRASSDPFTGKVFTSNSKPILDAALKSSIDKFLIEHSNQAEYRNIPRALGRKGASTAKMKSGDLISTSYSTDKPSKRIKINCKTVSNSAIDTSLDTAVQNALHAIRQRSSNCTLTATLKQPTKCFICNSTIYLYKIKTCKHSICRICFSQLKNSKTCICNVNFVNADIERIFE